MKLGTFARMKRIVTGLALVLVLLGIPVVIYADNTIADGDNTTPVAANPLNLGTVCVNHSVGGNVLIAISRNGNYSTSQVFKKNTTATISVVSKSPGLSALITTSPAEIAIPGNWDTVGNNTMTGSVSSSVTFTAGSTPGSFTGTVTYRATGTQSDDTPLTRDGTLTVSATISNTGECAPAPSDTTPPVITKTITGTSGANGWYTSNVAVAWTVTDPESTVIIDSGCGTQNFTTETKGVASTCSAHSAGGAASESVTVKIDTSGPRASLSVIAGSVGANGWYTSDVTISTTGSDTISEPTICTTDQFQTAETKGAVFNGSCTNNAGLTTNATALTIKLDKTGPELNPTVVPNPVLLNGSATASPEASDDISGIDKQGCESLDTSSIGEHTVICEATNGAGLLSKTSVKYQVNYGFLGLLPPYAAPPKFFKSGSTIPLKWQYTDANGVILNSAAANPAPSIYTAACGNFVGQAQTVDDTAGNSGLRYDTLANMWIFTWQTPKWPNTCYNIYIKSNQSGQTDGPFPLQLK